MYALGFSRQSDVDRFVATLERFERGEIDSEAWRGFRLLNGVYGQRQADAYMQRVKIPQGVLTPSMLRAIAQIARTYGEGRAHLTTRQNIQLYFLRLEQTEQAIADLARAGLTTKDACGNSVRNVIANPLAGVDPDEPFDVSPYAEAMTRHFLAGELSSSLPRKFKIAFEGNTRNVMHAAINDLSFFAEQGANGARCFRVLVGGGTSTLARSGEVLLEAAPASEILSIADAVVRVFHREGERANRKKARIKWLVKKLGWPETRRRILEEWELVKGTRPLAELTGTEPRIELAAARVATSPVAGFEEWRKRSVRRQKQPGLFSVWVTLLLGDLKPVQLEGLADLVERFALGDAAREDMLRTSIDQNLVLRSVAEADLPALHAELVRLALVRLGAGSFADVTSCAGADTCALAVTASRGMARDLNEYLQHDVGALGDDASLRGAQIKVSGCPNGCGQHHVASISLQGGVRKIGGRALPVYLLSVGGGAHYDADGKLLGARFARLVGKLPARRGREAIARLRQLHAQGAQAGEDLDTFLARVPTKQLASELADLFAIDEHTATAEDFIDMGQSEPFVTVNADEDEAAQ